MEHMGLAIWVQRLQLQDCRTLGCNASETCEDLGTSVLSVGQVGQVGQVGHSLGWLKLCES